MYGLRRVGFPILAAIAMVDLSFTLLSIAFHISLAVVKLIVGLSWDVTRLMIKMVPLVAGIVVFAGTLAVQMIVWLVMAAGLILSAIGHLDQASRRALAHRPVAATQQPARRANTSSYARHRARRGYP